MKTSKTTIKNNNNHDIFGLFCRLPSSPSGESSGSLSDQMKRSVTETKPQISLGLNIVEKERESLAIS